MAVAVKTLILRFRDLATSEGQTVALHRQIIKKYKYVWWGWWNKFGEKVPVDLFTDLNSRMKKGPLDLYLFDSGKNQLRAACCFEIRWAKEGARMRSPEPKRTPEYYKDQEYFAWFKFTDIASAITDAAVLHNLTYVEVPDFFESHVARFLPFYGKRIESVEELQHQNRTIWFVRPFRTGDRTGTAYAPPGKLETPFSTDPLGSHSSTLLWLSDVHFGNHAFPLTSDHLQKDLSQALEHDLKHNGLNSVAAVIVSGDLTWKNKKVEFGVAERFLNALRSWSTLDLNRLVFCPGNHDVRFSADPSKIGTPATLAPKDARQQYSEFYQRFYGHPANGFLSCGRRFLLGNAVPVDVVCLNSSLLEQFKGAFQGQGFVGQDQLTDAAEQMGWDKATSADAPRTFRVLVLHHHLLPVSYRPTPSVGYAASITWDAEAVVRWIIKNQVDSGIARAHARSIFCKNRTA